MNDKASLQAALLSLTLDRRAGVPLYRQLLEGLRALILSGRAAPGVRLPSSRHLAAELSVSRITAMAALEQLLAEGYLETRPGSGTYVAQDLPRPAVAPDWMPPPEAPRAPRPWAPLTPALPDMAAFPHADFARHLERAWRAPEPGLLARPDPFGWPALRAAIAAHLEAWRGLRCTGAQVIITTGAAESFDLIAQALFRPGAQVVVEEPSYAPMRAALAAAGLQTLALPVDAEGLPVARIPAAAAGVVVTPSRQYPLGMTLPLPRRLALLEHARRHGTWVIEDDYDSEFRYTGQPLPALASLDGAARVIYVGSFSKLLSPALRLGYLVAPVAVLPRLERRIATTGPRASLIPQPALAEFMASGAFAAHLRRMRRSYAARQRLLLQALAPLAGVLDLAPDPAGMHLVCRFRGALAGIDDLHVALRAETMGLGLRPLSMYFQDRAAAPRGLVIGYAGHPPDTLRQAAAQLAEVLRLWIGR